MSKAEVLFNALPLLRQHPLPRKVVVAARNAARQCSVEELSEFYTQRAYKDAAFLKEIGCQLQGYDASPSVYRGGTGEISRPIAKVEDSVGAESSSTKRSEGAPSTAKKRGSAVPTDRPSSGKDSPSTSLLGLLKEQNV